MSVDLETEVTAFNQFVEQRLKGCDLTLEESIQRFRQYQRELTDLRAKLQVAEEQSRRGESRPFDIEKTIARVRERLAREGITD